MVRVPIGQRIRERRREAGLAQAALAAELDISPAYLSLIEHDKRYIGGKLLRRIADALELDLDYLTADQDSRLVEALMELARALGHEELDAATAAGFVGRYPEWARAFIRLHRSLQDATETALALSERLGRDPELMALSHQMLTQITSIRSFSEILAEHDDLAGAERRRFAGIIASESDGLTSSARTMIDTLQQSGNAFRPSSPANEVDDFIIDNRNYFASIEDAASQLRTELSSERLLSLDVLHRRLTEQHGVAVTSADEAPGACTTDRCLELPEGAAPTTLRFRLAHRLCELELADTFEKLAVPGRFSSPDARLRAKRALARYAAGALLFPYDAFVEAAEELRYDLDGLGARFQASFEQAAHRLVTLRAPGKEGVPFAFLRTDPAGNISKRFSIPGLRMPEYGGACPRWAIYSALGQSDQIVSQLAAMPDGGRYLFVAKRVSKVAMAHGRPATVFSVMLGCEAHYADRIVYGDAFASRRASLITPVGFECRSCRREDCDQRAHPPVFRPGPGETAEPLAPTAARTGERQKIAEGV
ncbi:helix-turn-helix domain-containing protein [Amorphus orientalis]|uniref:Transcriptional regulator/transcriptional regulator with XRE-family HTH domain n=1 Tax=Amorphus orientalis TaxID=649198 RepID=A0AAE4AT72_9HYPH|nr:short-chain fatty acyl-CoA regulator family protein [Amorphus orientalis]MDQ0315973.1 putative transcriptional regulator/transcriptional regulator with XRE-family HTH domain [Amorphus orientalis]